MVFSRSRRAPSGGASRDPAGSSGAGAAGTRALRKTSSRRTVTDGGPSMPRRTSVGLSDTMTMVVRMEGRTIFSLRRRASTSTGRPSKYHGNRTRRKGSTLSAFPLLCRARTTAGGLFPRPGCRGDGRVGVLGGVQGGTSMRSAFLAAGSFLLEEDSTSGVILTKAPRPRQGNFGEKMEAFACVRVEVGGARAARSGEAANGVLPGRERLRLAGTRLWRRAG